MDVVLMALGIITGLLFCEVFLSWCILGELKKLNAKKITKINQGKACAEAKA